MFKRSTHLFVTFADKSNIKSPYWLKILERILSSTSLGSAGLTPYRLRSNNPRLIGKYRRVFGGSSVFVDGRARSNLDRR